MSSIDMTGLTTKQQQIARIQCSHLFEEWIEPIIEDNTLKCIWILWDNCDFVCDSNHDIPISKCKAGVSIKCFKKLNSEKNS